MRALLDRRRRVGLGGREPAADHGFILIVVISAIGILALVAASFAQITSSHVRAAAGAVQAAGAEALADAGVQLAILDLVASRQEGAQQRRFALNGTALACDAGDGNRLLVSVQDEAGKVDVNVAEERLIRALLAGAGIQANAAVADALLDFRDADDDRRPQGAERAEYRAAGRAHGPKNAPLSVVDELEQVLGLNAADMTALRPYVTVYSGQSAIEPSSASSALINILSRGKARAGVFTTTTEETEPDDRSRQLPPDFMGGSGRRFFSVRSEAHAGRAIFVREAIVELGTSRARPFTLHRWYRGSIGRNGPPNGAEADALPPC